ncbi:MAG: hypothetical protein R3B99_22870 [Polyangiales bacterium]|nr:hypothetical protein [Myxococcales bacterium]MCB9603232.1 hypothetical protein [Sandaracinus sp.]MCB9623001.1 hypothetical protein [Sandaracinus sp.]
MRCSLSLLLFVLACQDAPSISERRASVVESAPPPVPEPRALPEDDRMPAFPFVDDSELLRAPPRYDHLVPRLSPPTGPRFRNLVYEANNMTMRGSRSSDGALYASTGREIAERWRVAAAGVSKVFVLRDALFSQQDHPVDHDPVAVMMPPSWVTVAVAHVLEGRPIEPVHAPPIDDDEAWGAIETPGDLFGSFPVSQTLHEVATRPRTVLAPERLRVTNARRSVHMLARDAEVMAAAAPRGAAAVAEVGAERISLGDRRYFGERLRREHIILIGVENPNRHEIVDEAKGLTVAGRELPEEAVTLARRAIYGRRLRDGDLAVERYHLGEPVERRRAVAVLEELIPRDGSPEGGTVWLWVHGGLDPRGVRGTDATRHIGMFRQEVAAANVDVRRLRYLSKPHVPIGGRNLAQQLDSHARRFRSLDLPLSLNIGSGLLARLFEDLEARRPSSAAP